jgi:transposase InsO family protein
LSVGRKGQCWDNAVADSFFASLKGELTDIRAWPTRAAACRAIVEYIAWYNGTGTAPWATAVPPTSKTVATERSGM